MRSNLLEYQSGVTSYYVQCIFSIGNTWIQFHANNFRTDAQILYTSGTSGTSNTNNLNFHVSNALMDTLHLKTPKYLQGKLIMLSGFYLFLSGIICA